MDVKSTVKTGVITVFLSTIILCGLFISGITAYLIAADRAANRTSAGNNEIEIREVFDNPDIEPDEITEITKQVTVKNTGINCAGVRVRVEFSSSDVERTDPADTAKWAVVDYNTTNWQKSGDYWYYKTPLARGETTEPLFRRITCDHPTSEQVRDFDVFIYAESRNCEANDSLSVIKRLF